MPRFSLNKLLALILSAVVTMTASAAATEPLQPKRDFRGAWIQTVFQGYDKRTTDQNKAYLTSLLDRLQAAGINVVIFQVRPSADAFYPSPLEPWSRHLTGTTGTPPSPMWDPLQFMVDQCHARGMELHAWLNPYRVTASASEALPGSHLAKTQPKRFVTYAKRLYFNPALPENRQHIVAVVRDIVTRYDVDGIHFDDYFYPYPVAGATFDDERQWKASPRKMPLADWRRLNVDILIESVHQAIADTKPWVRFGISPFGIWRNRTSDPDGSATSGLQNYDDLYADPTSWAKRGWIDYQIPQLYWEMDHKRAPYRVLCDWWARHGHGRHIYIGQDVKKTAEAGELRAKLAQIQGLGQEQVQGSCWWYAANLSDLGCIYTTPALVPEYLWLTTNPAPKPTDVKFHQGRLSWKRHADAAKWVVYRFNSPSEIDTENPRAIQTVTYSPEFTPMVGGCYVITALDRANGESACSVPVIVP